LSKISSCKCSVCGKQAGFWRLKRKQLKSERAYTTNRLGPDWAGALLLIFLGQSDREQASSVNSFGFEIFSCVCVFSEEESRARPALGGRRGRAREKTSRSGRSRAALVRVPTLCCCCRQRSAGHLRVLTARLGRLRQTCLIQVPRHRNRFCS
jgi:hypothetical protein